MAVIMLKITCAEAARFAADVAPNAASTAVDVVPMFAPITIAPAAYKPITPLEAAVIVIAMDALEDWVKMVMIIPTSKYMNMPLTPLAVSCSSENDATAPSKAVFNTSIPVKKRPKPTNTVPIAAGLPR